MEPRLGIELGLSAAELLQFLKEDGSSDSLSSFVNPLISPLILSEIGNTAKNLDVTKVPKRLHLFDKEGMAEWLDDEKENESAVPRENKKGSQESLEQCKVNFRCD